MPLLPSPDPAAAADADAAAQAALLAGRVRAVALPPRLLSGWSSLCAVEYGAAVGQLQATLSAAADALAQAGRPA